MPNPWDKLPDESEAAWRAFCHYRDTGPVERKLVRTYRFVYNQPKAKSATGFVLKWAKDNKWKERAEAWDNRLHAVKQASVERTVEAEAADWARRREQVRDEAWANADKLVKKAVEMLTFPLATVERETAREEGPDGEIIVHKTIVNPAGWKMRDAPVMLKIAEDLRRLAAGMETEITRAELKVEVEGYLNELRAGGENVDININEVIEIAESMTKVGKIKKEKD
jgi:hypothetical protein